MFRFFKSFILKVLLIALAGGVCYLFTDSFGHKWRRFAMAKMEERGLHISFTRLGLHPVYGLVAREVKVFNDAARQHVLMTIDRLNLDLDYGKLAKKQFFVEGLELSDANVALPIDPDHPEAGAVELRDLNARAYLMDDRLEIRKAEGQVAGVRMAVTGSILLPAATQEGQEKKEEDRSAQRMAFLRERRDQIQEGLHWLKRFSFARPPRLSLEVNGVADKLENINVSLHFKAEGLGYETYRAKELTAEADYGGGVVKIREVQLKDAVGTLAASALWDMAGDSIKFRLHATADLPQLARSFLESDALREIVFYESAPPSLTLDGTWYVKGPKAVQKRPLEALGQVQCGRFNSRGEIFEGLSASFGVAPEGFYIRDGLLRHRSGSFALQAMYQEIEGFKYRAVLRMDPHAFLPFAERENTRALIRRFEFGDSSTIFVGLEGQGPDASLSSCKNTGRAEFRDVKYRGVEFNSAAAELEIFNDKLIFRNVATTLRSGTAEAAEVLVEDAEDWVRLTGLKAKLDPVPLTSCFARQAANAIARYHFSPGTELSLDGMIGTEVRTTNLTDFTVKFKTSDGTATYPLWGKDYLIHSPAGTLGFKGSKLNYDIKGKIFGGAMTARGHADLDQDWLYDVDLSSEKFPYDVLGKEVQFQNLKAVVKGGKTTSPFDIKAGVLGGGMSLKGSMDVAAKSAAYRGSLKLDAISFQRFAKVYMPGQETEAGDLTGHMEFTGRSGDWKALKGTGALVLLNGNLYAVPVLGPLTPLLGALLPAPIKGYNVAREASCTFQVGDGFAVTDDLEALTSAFKLLVHGSIDYIKDDIHFTAQARARGLPGLVLLPVSELLEYKGEGTVANPNWRPHYFSLGDHRKDERKAPSSAELEAAAKAAQQSGGQASPAPARPRTTMPALRR